MVLADGFAVLAGDARVEKGEDVEIIVLKPLSPLSI
jgi:hypothetical protein